MASSRKRPRSDLAERVREQLLRHVPAGARVTLALSGGIDSIVALDILAPLARSYPFALSCVHVNHGISPNARVWAKFAAAAARRRGVRCAVRTVDRRPYRPLGPEGAARAARYAVFAGLRSDFVVLAQHQDDQAETVLLQLIRGAGLPGLAAMPAIRPQTGRRAPRLLRPLLGVPREAIERYAHERRCAWIEDETNADERLARNLLRRRVMPLLRRLNAEAPGNLARSAGHLAEANELTGALAAIDAADSTRNGRLSVDALRRLPRARAKNVLRWMIAAGGQAAPTSAQLEELLRQLLAGRDDAAVAVSLDAVEVRRYRGEIWLVAAQSRPPQGFRARWNRRRNWPLPELGGVLRFRAGRGEGISAAALAEGPLEARLRKGGERFQPDRKRPRRALKDLLQEAGVPPWERERLPLLFAGERLVLVPGIGVAAGFHAEPGERGFVVAWDRLVVERPTRPKAMLK